MALKFPFQKKFTPILLLLFLVNLSVVYGQDSLATDTVTKGHWKPGYVVLNNKDTLYGNIKKRSNSQAQKVDFRDTVTNVKTPYTIEDLRLYVWGDELYMPVFHKNGTMSYGLGNLMFGKVIVNGYARLFSVEESGLINQIIYIVKKKGEKPIEIQSNLFGVSGKRSLAKYLNDNESLSKNILESDFKVEDLEKIVTDYNYWKRSQDRLNEVREDSGQ